LARVARACNKPVVQIGAEAGALLVGNARQVLAEAAPLRDVLQDADQRHELAVAKAGAAHLANPQVLAPGRDGFELQVIGDAAGERGLEGFAHDFFAGLGVVAEGLLDRHRRGRVGDFQESAQAERPPQDAGLHVQFPGSAAAHLLRFVQQPGLTLEFRLQSGLGGRFSQQPELRVRHDARASPQTDAEARLVRSNHPMRRLIPVDLRAFADEVARLAADDLIESTAQQL
jgi:hypothetical protein